MKSIRLKITIHLNGNHALSFDQLNALKWPIERGLAGSLPDWIAVDTINVTKATEMKKPERKRAFAESRRAWRRETAGRSGNLLVVNHATKAGASRFIFCSHRPTVRLFDSQMEMLVRLPPKNNSN